LTLDFSTFDFGNGFDFSSFLDGGSTITNQRGAALFDTAKTRCNTIISDCRKKGVDGSLITASYDLDIDKQCVAYERSLIDSNDQMKSTIRNATTVLQQARLMVAQNKNKYDLKGCVSALDTCMQDDFVCGDGYKGCLDSSGASISDGEVVIGSSPSISSLQDDDALETLLKDKIGSIDKDGKAIGMCASVLNQCQTYTFKNNVYNADNKVVDEYVKRTIINIKAKQYEVLASYGETCRMDIISCFTRNGATSSGTVSPLTTAINACSSYLNTCSSTLGVNGFEGDVALYVCPTGTTCDDSSTLQKGLGNYGGWKCGCICPANSTYNAAKTTAAVGTTTTQGVPFKYCECNNNGVVAIGGTCPTSPTSPTS
jgi:hypothetical protein